MSERIVVLGSNSFSGSHFVNYALKDGASVVGMSRSPEPAAVFLPYKSINSPDFLFHQLDLNHDLDEIMRVITEFQPHYVVNFAAQSMVGESWQWPEHWFQTNTLATVKLHDQLRRLPFLDKYVHVSTPEVYGSTSGLVSESCDYHPSTPYAVSRAAADMNLMSFFRTYHFPVVFTRAANVYGPGQQLYRIIPRAILFFATQRTLQLHGGGRAVRSFIHIRDVAEATLRIARRAEPGSIYHLSTKENIAIKALVQRIADRMGVEFEQYVTTTRDRPGKDAAYLLDGRKALAELDWQALIDLGQGLDDTIAWVRTNLELLQKQPFDYIHKP